MELARRARNHEFAAKGVHGAGARLPHLDRIQESFGCHDVSGVRAQIGGPATEACASIGATAYTTGDSVAFSRAPDLRTAAHEAAHVVQQRAGVHLPGGIGQVGDVYEQHADQVADAVVKGLPAESLLDPFAQGSSPGGSGAVQCFVDRTSGSLNIAPFEEITVRGRGNTENKEFTAPGTQNKDTALVSTGGSLAKNPTFERDAIAFEKKLGALAWGHTAAQRGAATLALRAKEYLAHKAGAWDAKNQELEALLTSIGSDDVKYVGSAGKAAEAVMAVFDSGNIAEQMNHVYLFVTRLLKADLDADESTIDDLIQKAKMNLPLLRERRELVKKGQHIATIPASSPVATQWHQRALRNENEHSKDRTTLTAADMGIDLSERQKAIHTKQDSSWTEEDAAMWDEGARIWIINERDKWVHAQRELSLPVLAGASGYTNSIMNAAQLLDVNLLDTRLACIAFLLPPRHHSLVEILTAAEPYGLEFIHGQQMYRKIDPLAERELRSCGVQEKFPDELSGDAPTSAGPVDDIDAWSAERVTERDEPEDEPGGYIFRRMAELEKQLTFDRFAIRGIKSSIAAYQLWVKQRSSRSSKPSESDIKRDLVLLDAIQLACDEWNYRYDYASSAGPAEMINVNLDKHAKVVYEIMHAVHTRIAELTGKSKYALDDVKLLDTLTGGAVGQVRKVQVGNESKVWKPEQLPQTSAHAMPMAPHLIGIPYYGANLSNRSVATSKLDKAANTNVVPHTSFGVYEGHTGQLQDFFPGTMMERVPQPGRASFLTNPAVVKDLCNLQFLDYLTEQVDRHSRNIMISDSGARGIDNDFAMGSVQVGDVPNLSKLESQAGRKIIVNHGIPKYVDVAVAESVLNTTQVDEKLNKMGSKGMLAPNEVEATRARLKELRRKLGTEIQIVNDWNVVIRDIALNGPPPGSYIAYLLLQPGKPY